MPGHLLRRLPVILLLAAAAAAPLPAATLYRVEAESAPATATWQPGSLADASAGAVLQAGAQDAIGESNGLPVSFPAAGDFAIWVRYLKASEGCAAFYVLLRDEDGEALAYRRCDFVPVMPTSQPYLPSTAAPAGVVWECLRLTVERPLRGTVQFGGYIHRGGYGPRQVDCLLVTDQLRLKPAELDRQAVERVPLATPPGPQSPLRQKPEPTLFAGVSTPEQQFQAGLIHCGSAFIDSTQALLYGFNRDHTGGLGRGLKVMYPVESFGEAAADFTAAHPAPEGRFTNAEGSVGSLWSLSYPPLRDQLRPLLAERLEKVKSNPDIECWRISGEVGGWLDYSPASVAAFRQWLRDKHGSIDTLNSRWGSRYADFEAISPPAKFADNRPCWLEFRDFCGTVFAESVGRQLPLIRELDPLHRPCIGQNSNLDLLAPYFTAMRPMDWEQYVAVGLQGERYVGWDTYCADDFLGCEVDLMRSLAPGRELLNEEWNPHATDPRIMARSFWMQVGKGLRGVYAFMFHEGTGHDSYPKWALVRSDLTPKDKLGALSDAVQEVHRLEPVLTRAQVAYGVKPVALYYSRLDLSVAQPHLSLWADSADSPYHVYQILRGLGYAVRWITPRQIVAGELSNVGAVVLVDAQYVPQAAAERLAAWVQEGGVVVGDRWPGAFNEYARPQQTLAPVFGVKAVAAPAPAAAAGNTLAMQQSSQGYGEVTIGALSPSTLAESVGEMWQQWDATHPVARAVGDFMLSGYGLQEADCTAGQVIGMTFNGRPGVVLNEPGRGHALYFAMMLGSIYESAAAKYEWDSAHSGRAFGRILAAFLTHAGVRPASVAVLPTARLADKLRVEAPLVTPEGEALVFLSSVNDAPLPSFHLEVELPEGARSPRQVFAALGGSRRLLPVSAQVKGTRLVARMPGFGTHATLLLLSQPRPVVGLEVAGGGAAGRGAAGLLQVRPGTVLTVQATVHNPGPSPLPAAKAGLWLPRGWTCDQEAVAVPAVPPGASRTFSFRVTPPARCGGVRLRPLAIRYPGAAPATEMVWWRA